MISVHVSALFKKLFITEAISTYQVITVPKNMTSTYISHVVVVVVVSHIQRIGYQPEKTRDVHYWVLDTLLTQ